MELRNALTRKQADALYEPAEVLYQVELADNNTDDVLVGDMETDRSILLRYSFQLPIGDREISGTLLFTIDAGTVELTHEYVFIPPEITGVRYMPARAGQGVFLRITTTAVGENPVFLYSKRASKKAL